MQKLTLTPVKQKFQDRTQRGMYARTIRQFLASGEDELNVAAQDMHNAYLGLRAAVSNMGLKGRVYVQQQSGEVHLIRRG